MDYEYKMVIVTRKDLKLSAGKLAVQVAHASVACALESKGKKNKWFKKWIAEGSKKVILKVENVEHFFELKENAETLDIVSVIITDAGHTEIPSGTITVIGIGPAPTNIIDKITGKLSLL
jgi:PTH2 family peptidyl-tRNA hydrolase